MKTTSHGTFSYEKDEWDDSENRYMVYLDDEEIGEISMTYKWRKGCSNAHGWTDVKEGRDKWYFCDFEPKHMSQGDSPSDAINRMFDGDEFHNIKGAFKRCVELICQHLDYVQLSAAQNDLIEMSLDKSLRERRADVEHLGQIGIDLHDGKGWTMFWHVDMDDDWREDYGLDEDISVWDARTFIAPPVAGFSMFADSAAECTNVPHLLEEGASIDDIIVMSIDGDEAVWIRDGVVE